MSVANDRSVAVTPGVTHFGAYHPPLDGHFWISNWIIFRFFLYNVLDFQLFDLQLYYFCGKVSWIVSKGDYDISWIVFFDDMLFGLLFRERITHNLRRTCFKWKITFKASFPPQTNPRLRHSCWKLLQIYLIFTGVIIVPICITCICIMVINYLNS